MSNKKWLHNQAKIVVESKISPGIGISHFCQYAWDDIFYGTFDGTHAVNEGVYYDIASLTKTFTATLILLEITRNNLRLEDKVWDFLDFVPRAPSLTFENVLSHKSGLEILHKYDKNGFYSKSEIENIFQNPDNLVVQQPGYYRYTDLNYLFLGLILEKVTNKKLSTLIQNLNQAYGIFEICYDPRSHDSVKSIAPSQGGLDPGSVQDEKSRWHGGETGHAGLFATINGLKNFVVAWLRNDWGFSENLHKLAFNPTSPSNNLNQAFGLVWRRGWLSTFPNHAGFSGPTIILDFESHEAIVHVCNYNFPNRNIAQRERFLEWNRSLTNYNLR